MHVLAVSLWTKNNYHGISSELNITLQRIHREWMVKMINYEYMKHLYLNVGYIPDAFSYPG